MDRAKTLQQGVSDPERIAQYPVRVGYQIRIFALQIAENLRLQEPEPPLEVQGSEITSEGCVPLTAMRIHPDQSSPPQNSLYKARRLCVDQGLQACVPSAIRLMIW